MRKILRTFLFLPALLLVWGVMPPAEGDVSATGTVRLTGAEDNRDREEWLFLEAEEGEESEENEEGREEASALTFALASTYTDYTRLTGQKLKTALIKTSQTTEKDTPNRLRAPPSFT